ncbi:MAG: potassium channel family protein [Gemmatimonadales bacterium]
MHVLALIAGIALLVGVLRDAFETIILPRRVNRRFRFTTLFYRAVWPPWRAAALACHGGTRENMLSWFGPFSLLLLLAFWAIGIVAAFGVLQWSAGSALRMANSMPHLLDDLYLSGTTFFTLGIGDVVPRDGIAKFLTVSESGLGFAFLAIVIGYLPVIYQAFSRREIAISMLDARAGSPPSAGELLRRDPGATDQERLIQLLAEWERWSAEVLESHLSYPVLAYFRSQHSNQSWLAALTTILDTSSLVIVGFDGWCLRQARLTFAMARHAVVDLAQVFGAREITSTPDRLADDEFAKLVAQLERAGIRFTSPDARQELRELRAMYEPYVTALAARLAVALPNWTRAPTLLDNWERAPWTPREPEHFDGG